MSLLIEIQNAAIDSNTELAVLIRKCKVLAVRLGNKEFKQWVENELSGYDDDGNFPEYRFLKVNSKGNFSGPFQSKLSNVDIPLSCINKKFYKNLSCHYLKPSVAVLETLVQDTKEGGTLQVPWNPDLVAYISQDIYENMTCVQAWKVIPVTRIVAALDAVRNRILNFVLEIEAESPGAGEAPVNSNPVSQEKVRNIYNTHITGSVQNVATGSSNVNQNAVNNPANEALFKELLSALHRVVGEDRSIVTELTSTVEKMQSSQGNETFKGHYQNFMSILANHMQVFGPVVAPFLSKLAAIIP